MRKTRNITIEGVNFKETTFANSGLMDVIDVLSGSHNIKSIGNHILISIGLGSYLKRYESLEQLMNDKKQFDYYYNEFEKSHSAYMQVPEVTGHLLFNNNYYLMLTYRIALMGETDEFYYKGMVVDIENYKKIIFTKKWFDLID